MKSLINITAILLSVAVILGSTGSVQAQVPVSATVQGTSFNPPTLLAPINQAVLNHTQPTFSFARPSPNPGNLRHYDFYLDDQVFAASIPDSLTSADYYFYYTYRSGDIFYVTIKTDLAQGYHNWKVVAYNEAGISAQSETRIFYVDSNAPVISVSQIDTTELEWNSTNPASLPTGDDRYVSVNTSSPTLQGTVERFSNFQIILVCPQNIPSCSDQVFTENNTTGQWTRMFSGLFPNATYTVRLSATDAAENSTVFPDFFITYGTVTVTPTPTLTITPTITSTPTISVTPTIFPSPPEATPSVSVEPTLPLPTDSVTPPPLSLVTITPAPYIPPAPPAPTPPPPDTKPVRRVVDLFFSFILVLMIIGLPTHLLMAIIGVKAPIKFIPKFLAVLAFPFLISKKNRTLPFCFIEIYISDKLISPWQQIVSDIKGNFALKAPVPESTYVTIVCAGRKWKNVIIKGSLLPTSCLFPVREKASNGSGELRRTIYDTRVVPLIIACLTSTIALIISPSYPILIYMYFSYQYLFSEYLYPRIASN